jgi:hypothetical protein
MTMKSKKSGGYSPKYGAPPGPLMKVWKMVKKMLPFFGTRPFLRMSSGRCAPAHRREGREGVVGLVGQDVAVGQEQDARGAWAPPLFQSARFQRLWNSFQASWKAMKVLPVPVASVSRMRSRQLRRWPPARG